MILSPRDFIVYRMTDQLVTDATFASRSRLHDFDGNAVRELAGPALGKLPSVVPSDTSSDGSSRYRRPSSGCDQGCPSSSGLVIGSARCSVRACRNTTPW